MPGYYQSTFELGEAEWVIHRYRQPDFVIEPGATLPFDGLIEGVSVRFKPAHGEIVGYGEITVPTLAELAQLLLSRVEARA